ncbi:40S ribosomal protein S4 [Capsicum baccatum]|uniref:40S ribosomal protein S4 n=1 Tax=Capsicum baccatum TaxID=33114 RepID=A0A2G2X4W3_CAPBA|nr:40S ribosomal protein S4 [Capsicum baccatum]
MQRQVLVDGKVRTDKTYPAGFMDVVSIPKTNESFCLLYDIKGRFRLHSLRDEEAKFKICKLDLKSNKTVDFIKFDVGNVVMVTGGRNRERVGVIKNREKHKGRFETVNIQDALGHEFSTRMEMCSLLARVLSHEFHYPKDQGVPHSFLEVEIDPYSHQVIKQPSEYLMDVLHPYRIVSTPFLCRQIDGQRYHLPNAQFANQGITLSFRDL